MVAKFNPTRLGNRKVFLSESHVPSPTCSVFEEYELLPGGASDEDILVAEAFDQDGEECGLYWGRPCCCTTL